MKLYLLVFACFLSFAIISQTTPPFSINYQGVARDASGQPIINQTINIKFEIFNVAVGGTAEFTENQPGISTGSLGLFYTQIGIKPLSDLSAVTWSVGSHFLEVTISGSFGSGTLLRSQLVTVPYAFYAAKAGWAPAPMVSFTNNILSVGGNTALINTSSSQSISIAQGGITQVTSLGQNFTVSVPSQTFTPAGNTITSNLGGSFTIPSSSTLALTGTTLSLGSPTNAVNLASLSPWVQMAGNVTLANASSNVGIGLALPNAKLEISVTSTANANALQINNGHIKSVGSMPTITTQTFFGGFSSPILNLNGTDVKGTFTINTSVTSFTAINFCDVKINFNKIFTSIPVVVATPLNDLNGLFFYIKDIQLNYFIISIYRPNGTSIPPSLSPGNYRFNYFVIE